MHIVGEENGYKANDREKVLEELFHDEASGGEDNNSESSWELSDNVEKMSDVTGHGCTLVWKPRWLT